MSSAKRKRTLGLLAGCGAAIAALTAVRRKKTVQRCQFRVMLKPPCYLLHHGVHGEHGENNLNLLRVLRVLRGEFLESMLEWLINKKNGVAMKNGKLRSQEWFARGSRDSFVHRAWLKSEGFSDAVFDNRPVIGIANSWSELTNCNSHLREVAEAVKRGVFMAGGLPLEFPVISLGEPFMKPTTMMFRNLMAMDVEECIRANPLDGVVLLCGCDKTTPAQLMGAASADLPAIMVPGGPMLRGVWPGEELGSGTDIWRCWEEFRAGRISEEDWSEVEGCISRSNGHCMVMGTASTMTSIAEALGMTLTGCANVPAPDSRRYVMAELSGARIVDMVYEDLCPSAIMTREAFENAIRVDMAIGGSTNAIIHLIALAGRLGVDLPLQLFDDLAKTTPFLANIRPSGKYLMEDMYYAGGLP